jgi:hypothetical protein
MGWDGMGWDGMGWNGTGWDGMGWDGMGWDGMGWDGWSGENLVSIGMIFVKEFLDLGHRITIDLLHAHRWKSHCNNTIRYVCSF